MINYYGEDADYIHLKFGDMRKAYYFTDEFVAKHPEFCKEYKKYWVRDESCRFKSPLHILSYVDDYNIPVHFYYNYTDTPADSIADIYAYLIREDKVDMARNPDGSFRMDYEHGLDGEEEDRKSYKVKVVPDKEK